MGSSLGPSESLQDALAQAIVEANTRQAIDWKAIAESLRTGQAINAWGLPDPSTNELGRHLAGNNTFNFPNIFESPETRSIRAQVSALTQELQDTKSRVEAEASSAMANKAALAKLTEVYAELQKKSELQYLLTRLDEKAHSKILNDSGFAAKFESGSVSNAYVISLDIRRSTELMLKARSPQAFADFISNVSAALSSIITSYFGVFDKFTGDGMLGFFPQFYSGDDFGNRVLTVAKNCHTTFNELYTKHRSAFDTVLRDVGLGIGIDYGDVQLMRIADGLTVVGRPVVYACRLNGGPAGSTFVNQGARDRLLARHADDVRFEIRDYEIKSEGHILVSEVVEFPNKRSDEPAWMTSPV